MKKITLILTSMLFLLVGGVKADPVKLDLSCHGNGVWTSEKSGYTEVEFQHSVFNGKHNGWRGSDWVTTLPSGKKHRFVFTFNSGVTSDLTLHFVATSVEDWGSDETKKIVDEVIPEGATSFQCDVDKSYALIQVVNTGSSNKKIEVVSVTREEIAASSVDKPTITAPATYDGESTAVIITPGANNHHVKYSVSGSSSDVSDFQISSETTIYITGTSDVTITAIGYNEDESDLNTDTKTITYSNVIQDGKTNIANNISTEFSSWNNNLQYNNEFQNKVGLYDYVVLSVSNMTKDHALLGFRDGGNNWNEEPYRSCTTVSRGNGAKGVINNGETQWWLKVSNDDVLSAFSRQVVIQGGLMSDESTSSPITLNSIDVYKSFAISETENNSITKYNNVVVELTRSFVADTWNTVCLPFTLTSAQATQLFGEGYKLAEFTAVSGTTMQFTTASSFVAGVPYLVKPTINVSNASPVVLVDVDITAKTPQTVTHEGYSFVGKFTKKTFSSNECSTSRFVATENELKKPTDNSTLKSLRCYFTVPAVAPARSLSFDVDEEGNTTGVADINRETITNNGDFFNLAGQRVAQPTKGLYIVNGKKVVIK